MFGICLVVALAAGDVTPAHDVRSELDDLKRSIESLRKEQEEQRVEVLKLKIAELAQQKLEHKLKEISKSLAELKAESYLQGYGWPTPAYGWPTPAYGWPHPPAVGLPYPMSSSDRATIQLEVPTDCTAYVDGRAIPVPAGRTTFVTPPLPEGKQYFYNFKVELRGEKPEARARKVSVRPGEVVTLRYQDMAAPGGAPPGAPPPPPPEKE